MARKATTRKTAAKKKAAAGRKTTARKTAARKTTARGTTARKATARRKTAARAAAPAAKATAIREPMSKSQILAHLAERTGLARKQVGQLLDELGQLIERHIKPRGAGEFRLPGLLKIRTVKKKATRARKGINPFTGEEIMIKAKPARTVVKVTPLKKLKEMVQK
ncbi:MAG: integration host factor [Gammaproteobacteria bacterium]|nr:MAG: integration host factor [Gammaproteobacteria bacterium]